MLLRLTAKGERAYAAIAVAARRRHDNLLGALSAAQRKALERALGKLQARATAMLAAPDLGFGSGAGAAGRGRRAKRPRTGSPA
jgi:hypothetical protein